MSTDPKTQATTPNATGVAAASADTGATAVTPVTWEAGAELPTLTVTPDRYVTVRYAGASGDFNPIHVDDEFAQQVGLPGKILHGLWTMAQVARAQTDAVGGPRAPAALKRLSVEFRGMAVPEQEIAVTSKVKSVADGIATVSTQAKQGSTRVVRNGVAEIVLPSEAKGLSR